MTQSLIDIFRKNGITKEAQILMNGIRFWDLPNKKELRIYKDADSISYIYGADSSNFPYSDDIEGWPDRFIEILHKVGVINV